MKMLSKECNIPANSDWTTQNFWKSVECTQGWTYVNDHVILYKAALLICGLIPYLSFCKKRVQKLIVHSQTAKLCLTSLFAVVIYEENMFVRRY